MTKRTADNFTLFEQNALLTCVRNQLSIIECKKTDGTSSKDKNEAWTRVCKEFNEMKHVSPRDETQLRNLWDRLKKAAKKEAGDDARECRKTGGGEFITRICDISLKVRDMIPDQINPPVTLQNKCDSDAPSLKPVSSQPLLSTCNQPSEHPQTSTEVHVRPQMSDHEEGILEDRCGISRDIQQRQPALKRPAMNQSEYFTTIINIMKQESEEKMSMRREEHRVKMETLNIAKEIKIRKLKKLKEDDITLTDISYCNINSLVNDIE